MSSSVPHRSAYAESGVNIDAGNRAVSLMTQAVKSTYGPEVLAGIGAFGGLFDASKVQAMQSPVLVASTDGVGTKVKLAAKAGRYESIGWDIVNHCINDILVQAARPIFFLDYIASSVLNPEMIAEVVGGISAACKEAGCALLGGETAEMPGVYAAGEFDVAGTIVGVVERNRILPRTDLKPGDLLVGFRSSGLHTNGYSLVRKTLESADLSLTPPSMGTSLLDALLVPHKSYLPVLGAEVASPTCRIKALAHITGGGFIENIPRVLPEEVDANIKLGSWPIPPLFHYIQDHGEITEDEMFRVFNMGVGMIAVVAQEECDAFRAAIQEESFLIGELVKGGRKVKLI